MSAFFSRILPAALTALLLAPVSLCAAPPASADLAEQIRTILSQNPDILLNVLREHSEAMLDIVQQGSEERRRQALSRQWESDRQTPKTFKVEGRPVRGPENAPVTLTAFSDFTCAYCQQAAYTVETLLKRYPRQIRFLFKQSPGSEQSKLASRWFVAASQIDQAKAWKFYALLFDSQSRFASDPLAVLRSTAEKAGLDAKKVEARVASQRKAIDTLIAEDQEDAKRLGFAGTPYFLVDDMVIRGALPLENFVDAVELALKNPRPQQ